MITGFFLQLFLSILAFIVGLLPTVGFPTQISAGILLFWSYVNLFSMVIPVGTIVLILGLMLMYQGAYLLWLFAHWIMRRFRH